MRQSLLQGFRISCGVMFCLSGFCVYRTMGADREVETHKAAKMYSVAFKADNGRERSRRKIEQKKVVKKREARKVKSCWKSAKIGRKPRLSNTGVGKREYGGSWRRPLLDKRVVAGRQFGVGNFNRSWDDKLRIVNDRHHMILSGKGVEPLHTRRQLSSKGLRGFSVKGSSGQREREHGQHSRWSNQRLGRITVYWAKGRGADRYTRRLQSATGVRLMRGHCAVDPAIIPYGSVVRVHGVGDFWAVDTGSAVRTRKAARRLGRSHEEREAIVVDLFFPNRQEALAMARRIPRFTMVSWKALPK